MALLFRLVKAAAGASVLSLTLPALIAAPASPARDGLGFTPRELRQEGEKTKSANARGNKESEEALKRISKSERRELITRAQVWSPTNIPSMDLRRGPAGPQAFEPWQDVTCDYVADADLPGTSRKFN